MKRLPSAREMEASRITINVVCVDGLARLVNAELQPDGFWAAGLEEDCFGRMPGHGDTWGSAILDLLTPDQP